VEEQMRKLTLALAAASCVGLCAPAFAIEKAPVRQSGTQVTTDVTAAGATDVSAAKKKAKKKKGTTARKSWGG
jgi:protein-disulfide isomerase